MSKKEGYEACPRCVKNNRDKSGDNLRVYGNEKGAYCWSCGYTEPSADWLKENGDNDNDAEEFELMTTEFNQDIHDSIKGITGTNSKNYRGIREETSKPFGVRYEVDQETGEIAASYYPCTVGGKISGYKIRKHPKHFSSVGECGKAADLFGQFKFAKTTQTRSVVVAMGEVDCLSVYQILTDYQASKGYDPVAVVSPTIGESGGHKQMQLQYEFFNRFEKIILCGDQDAAGLAALEKMVAVLPKGKVFIMTLPMKDANEMLAAGKGRQLISAYFQAVPYTPPGVKSAQQGLNEIKDELLKDRISLPPYMNKLQGMMGGGVIQGRIMNVIAFTSVGKSFHVNRMVYHFIFNSPVVPTIVSLEATASQYMLEMLSIHLEDNLLWNKSPKDIIEFLETEEGIKAQKELAYKEDGSPRFFIIDDRAGSIKDMELELEMLHTKYNSKLFVIDVLSDLLRGSNEGYSEDAMNFQRNMAKNGVTFINVLHTRKPQQSKDGEIKKVTEYDALGTGSFVQSAHYNIVLNRDKLSDNEIDKNTTEVDLVKCRGGRAGAAGKWFCDFNRSKCHDLEDYFRSNPKIAADYRESQKEDY